MLVLSWTLILSHIPLRVYHNTVRIMPPGPYVLTEVLQYLIFCYFRFYATVHYRITDAPSLIGSLGTLVRSLSFEKSFLGHDFHYSTFHRSMSFIISCCRCQVSQLLYSCLCTTWVFIFSLVA